MYSFRTISIIPRLPESIGRLRELAYNLWFSWNDKATGLFRSINAELWEEVYHNPVQFLLRVDESELKTAAGNEQFLNQYREVIADFDHYMHSKTRYDREKGQNFTDSHLIAYFSAEFGLHEAHPTYSGGLGLLAGDHCKTASDLGLPFVGVGLLYKHGYFTQRINREGRQEVHYQYLNFDEMPITLVLDEDGRDLVVAVELPGRRVYARVWRMLVGRVRIFFLDANITVNSLEDRELTGQLYGGNQDTRISQEILLGIGGVRALRAMGIHPTVWHINEGHAAFLLVERLRELVREEGLSPGAALEALRADTLFTTHTPVPAGHDVFDLDMVDRYFGHLYKQLGMSREQFHALAYDRERNGFNMTMLALGASGFCNGVSRLHGAVTRTMFGHLYPGIPGEEVPIGHVTNGAHTLTWLAPEMRSLFDKYLGLGWSGNISRAAIWDKVNNIPDRELWAVHASRKEKMLRFVRGRLVKQRMRNQETVNRVNEVGNYLRPDVLTIGFARRFATYKRAGLLFRDRDRLDALVNNPKHPVQFVFAGKAHPADKPGQELIKLINDIAGDDRFQGKVVFVEDYDINVSRYLLQGVDVWLNTPRRPMEASGTSGMKAAVNGVLNCSILDGWWPEGYNGQNGFAVGADWDFPDEESSDRYDFHSLYTLLEEVIVPAYYDQAAGVPRKWVRWMRESVKTIVPRFSTERMVLEYADKYYLRAMDRNKIFSADDYRVAGELYELKQFLRKNWHHVKITGVAASGAESMHLGEEMSVRATVELGPIPRENVRVEIAYGEVYERGLRRIETVPLAIDAGAGDNGGHVYTGSVILPQGIFGYTVRVRPYSPHFANKFELPLVCWAPAF